MSYKKIVEIEYQLIVDSYKNKKVSATSAEHILIYMLENPQKIWFWSWELANTQTKGGHIISHRGPARASDLAIYAPDFVEDRKVGRFCVYRLKRENISKILKHLKELELN